MQRVHTLLYNAVFAVGGSNVEKPSVSSKIHAPPDNAILFLFFFGLLTRKVYRRKFAGNRSYFHRLALFKTDPSRHGRWVACTLIHNDYSIALRAHERPMNR